ncbi:hypothetical protein EJ04DRAFT_269026 [Polyplosphaeria fusca]|uniref:Uncharacterized protein n=1 Tax=Polyplosphaeria fusca TaxID=682080 RepID=A0A9P4QW79_9PLEO|nr:hypothetical protein EJ04DRAFT_269026 [Polyplosphaeria fusca]
MTTTAGVIILPSVWDSAVIPGITVHLSFWSKPSAHAVLEKETAGPVVLHEPSRSRRSPSPEDHAVLTSKPEHVRAPPVVSFADTVKGRSWPRHVESSYPPVRRSDTGDSKSSFEMPIRIRRSETEDSKSSFEKPNRIRRSETEDSDIIIRRRPDIRGNQAEIDVRRAGRSRRDTIYRDDVSEEEIEDIRRDFPPPPPRPQPQPQPRSRSRSRSRSPSLPTRDDEEDDDAVIELDTDDEDVQSEQPPPPPPQPRHVAPAKDLEGNRLSFLVNTKWGPASSQQRPSKELVGSGENIGKAKRPHLRDMSTDIYRILKTVTVPTELRMTIQVHTLPLPESSPYSSNVSVRWTHLYADQLDFAQFKTACLNVSGLSERLKRLVAKTLEKVERERLRPSIDGMFIEPGTVLRGDEMERKDAQSVVFSCIPYLDLQPAPKLVTGSTEGLHPPLTLMQSYYPYHPVREKDMEQAVRKLNHGVPNSILYAPLMWLINIGTEAIVTAGYRPLHDDMVKSIEMVETDVKPLISPASPRLTDNQSNNQVTSIRLTDWDGRILLYSLEECKTFFEFEQKLRELKISSTARSEDFNLIWKHGKDSEPATPENWLDIIETKNSLFIELGFMEGGEKVESNKERTSLSDSPQTLVPPFFVWPSPETIQDKKVEDSTITTAENSGKGLSESQQFGFILPPTQRSMQYLEEVERALMASTNYYEDSGDIVDEEFTSTKYYQSLPQDTFEHVRDSFTLLIQNNTTFGKGTQPRSRHQIIVESQVPRITSLTTGLIDTVYATLKLFVSDVDNNTMLRRIWGAMINTGRIVSEVQKRGFLRPDPQEWTDPQWHADEPGRRKWAVRCPSASLHDGKYLMSPESNIELGQSIGKCATCAKRRWRGYSDPHAALAHMEKHAVKLSSSGKLNMSTKDPSLKDWIRNDEQELIEETNAGLLAILTQASKDAHALLKHIKELADGVRSPDGQRSNIYTFPNHMLRLLRMLISFYLAVERSLHFTEQLCSAHDIDASDWQKPGSERGLQVLKRFVDGTNDAIQATRRDLCQMTRTKTTDGWRERLSLGPHYLCGWFMRRLLVRPIETGMTVGDLYRDYLSDLRYQVNNRPSKRLLRSLNSLREEVQALARVNRWQLKLITSFCAVLNNATYEIDDPVRRSQFLEERALLLSCLDNLSDAAEDYDDIIRECGPLAENTKQSTEINEEDHGKAIFVFTVVTVIFLPLSFVTSFLGMNTSDLREMDNTQSLFWEIAIPVTAVTMLTIVITAYNGDVIRDRLSHYFRVFTRKQDGRDLTRDISAAQRRRASKITDSSSISDYKSIANEAEYQPPRTMFQPEADPYAKGRLAAFGLQDTQFQSTIKPDYIHKTAAESTYEPVPSYFSRLSAPEPRSGSNTVAEPQSTHTIPMSFPPPPPPPPLPSHSAPPRPPPPPPPPPTQMEMPNYPKVHKLAVDERTLTHFAIPWEYDTQNPSYRVLLVDAASLEMSALYTHTAELKNARRRRHREPPRDYWDKEDEWYTRPLGARHVRASPHQHRTADYWDDEDEWYVMPSRDYGSGGPRHVRPSQHRDRRRDYWDEDEWYTRPSRSYSYENRERNRGGPMRRGSFLNRDRDREWSGRGDVYGERERRPYGGRRDEE